ERDRVPGRRSRSVDRLAESDHVAPDALAGVRTGEEHVAMPIEVRGHEPRVLRGEGDGAAIGDAERIGGGRDVPGVRDDGSGINGPTIRATVWCSALAAVASIGPWANASVRVRQRIS